MTVPAGTLCTLAVSTPLGIPCDQPAVVELERLRRCGHSIGPAAACAGCASRYADTTAEKPSTCPRCGSTGHTVFRLPPDQPTTILFPEDS